MRRSRRACWFSLGIKAFIKLMNITKSSHKDEILSCAVELVDQQEAKIKDLQDKQKALFYLLGGLSVITLIF